MQLSVTAWQSLRAKHSQGDVICSQLGCATAAQVTCPPSHLHSQLSLTIGPSKPLQVAHISDGQPFTSSGVGVHCQPPGPQLSPGRGRPQQVPGGQSDGSTVWPGHFHAFW